MRPRSRIGDVPIGLATFDFPNNTDGPVTTFGLVRDINTSAFSDGDTVYLSATPGVLAATGTTRVGYVVRSHITQGVIIVDRA